MKIYTSEQIKQIEAAANEKGTSYLSMMENAGAAAIAHSMDELFDLLVK